MTLEELKAEADKLGYVVTKKYVPEGRKLQCSCGSKQFWTIRPNRFGNEAYVQCRRCKKKGPVIVKYPGERTDEVVAKAVKAWNDMIMEVAKGAEG